MAARGPDGCRSQLRPGGRRHGATEQRAYEAIHALIADGVLEPGATLRLEVLAGRIGTSTTPIRGALVRLEREGLVRRNARRGSTVAPLEIEDFEIIQAARWGIEGLAARLGAEALTPAAEARMRDHLERVRAAARDGDLGRYLEATYAMEDACYAAAGRARLLETVRHYRGAAQRYVRFAMRPDPGALQAAPAEAFYAAAAARDGALTERLIQREIDGILERLTQAIEASART